MIYYKRASLPHFYIPAGRFGERKYVDGTQIILSRYTYFLPNAARMLSERTGYTGEHYLCLIPKHLQLRDRTVEAFTQSTKKSWIAIHKYTESITRRDRPVEGKAWKTLPAFLKLFNSIYGRYPSIAFVFTYNIEKNSTDGISRQWCVGWFLPQNIRLVCGSTSDYIGIGERFGMEVSSKQ